MSFDERWHYVVLEDHLLWSELGCPIDVRDLPRPMQRAHLAVLEGKNERRRDEREKNEREARKARRTGAGPRGYRG